MRTFIIIHVVVVFYIKNLPIEGRGRRDRPCCYVVLSIVAEVEWYWSLEVVVEL